MKKPQLVPKAGYEPILSETEHRAYCAAHQIVAEDMRFPSFAIPNRRRIAQVDRIAQIIKECFGENT